MVYIMYIPRKVISITYIIYIFTKLNIYIWFISQIKLQNRLQYENFSGRILSGVGK